MDAVAVAEANLADSNPGPENTEAGVNGGEENRFQKAIAAWRSIGFAALIAQLDSTATDIISHQKDAVIERKDVAQRTKDFRKLDDAGKLSEYKTLLKAYQGFVDLLTTHGKEASSAFLQLYTPLSEAPDPFPLLEASIESLVVSEDTLPRLTAENTELQRRVDRLSRDLEAAESKLSAERQARKEAEQGSGKLSEDIEASWKKVLEEKESNWTSKEAMLEEKLENQDRLFKELRANYEVAQRLGGEERDHASQRAAAAELQLVVSDLDKTNTRLAEMNARNEQLRVELAQATSQRAHVSDDDPQVLRLQSENSIVLRKLDSMKFERDAQKNKADEHMRQLERQKRSMQNENQELRQRLQRCSDYDEVKRELEMLKSIELSVDDDEAEVNATTANGDLATAKSTSLEQLLLAKNKRLSDDLTLLRVSQKELLGQLDELKEDLMKTKGDLDDSQKLSARLENDLTILQEEAASGLPSSGMSVAGTYVSRYPHSSRRGRSSPTSSIISGFDGNTRSPYGLTEALGGGSGILPMVQAQRDRFKQKTQQLEEELQKTYATVTSLRQEVSSLQKDNLNLYEKTRYVSAYSRNGATSSSLGQGPSHAAVDMGDDGGRWKAQYEANISPFAAFRGRETARAYKRMNMPERMVFSLTRIVLATRTSRNLFAGYCLALHLLVFFMLYWMSAASAASSHLGFTISGAALSGAAAVKEGTENQANWHQEDFG